MGNLYTNPIDINEFTHITPEKKISMPTHQGWINPPQCSSPWNPQCSIWWNIHIIAHSHLIVAQNAMECGKRAKHNIHKYVPCKIYITFTSACYHMTQYIDLPVIVTAVSRGRNSRNSRDTWTSGQGQLWHASAATEIRRWTGKNWTGIVIVSCPNVPLSICPSQTTLLN